MAVTYQILLSNGTFLAAIPEDSINTTATSLQLFGRGLTEYGEKLQNNLVHILESFADSSQPSNPVVGQLWYDTLVGAIKVYDGVTFNDLKQVVNGSITNESVASLAGIELVKLEKGTPGNIIVIDGAGFARYIAMTGEVTIGSDGGTTINKDILVSLSGAVSGSVTQNNLDSFDIPTVLANNIVGTNNVQVSAITEPKLDSNSVSTTKILDLAVTTSKLADSVVTNLKLANSAITAIKIVSKTIGTNQLADGAVTASIIATGGIEQQHFSNSSIPTIAVQDLAITASKLGASSVVAGKLGGNSVTESEIAHGGTAASNFVLSFDGTSLEFVQIGGSIFADLSIAAQKLIPAVLAPDYGGLVAIPFSTEVTKEDLAETQTINIDYGGIV